MRPFRSIFLLPPLLLIISTSNLADFASASPLYYSCSVTGAPNSSYAANLDDLLRSLTSTAPATGYSNNTSGGDSNRVYGLVLCRGDVTREACRTCLQTGTTEMRQLCPNRSGAGVWYDDCRLRYSDQNFFSRVDESGKVYLSSNENISDPVPFHRILGDMFNNLSREAAFNRSTRMFATGEASFNGSNKLYGLVQCSRDLHPLDCNRCLNASISDLENCCAGKQGGRILGLSCNLRFELYRFFGPASTPPPSRPQSGKESKSRKMIKIILPTVAAMALVCGLGVYLLKQREETIIREWQEKNEGFLDTSVMNALVSSEDPLQFEFETIEAATNNFSPACKLGEGGFGPVYQGRLPSGREIAVKRLSGNSGQGIEEFKNEVVLIAKLQHRNLVRHLGFCVRKNEKILIYEFLHNKSLDYFLFDRTKRGYLNWEIRSKIIQGIARGLLYLHEDSRLKIIHRDLKASNILLDREMNPKISDFGMSRIFKTDQTLDNTSRIAGTFGYMSPEYAMHGHFSPKSDVYSFGVLALEILSGQKNSSFYQSTGTEDLLSYVDTNSPRRRQSSQIYKIKWIVYSFMQAWKLWKARRVLDLLDPCLDESFPRTEAITFVHIGLLCVQESVADRPNMSAVVLMLDSRSVTVPAPSPPGYFVASKMPSDIFSKEYDWQVSQSDASMSKLDSGSTNDYSITQLDPR